MTSMTRLSGAAPRLVVVDEILELSGGIRYVVSFVELWAWGTVVRMVGLSDGFVARMLELNLSLRDDTGRSYPHKATTSGGMVLSEEVVVGFTGVLDPAARRVDLVRGNSGHVVASAGVAGQSV
ncbi:hypothetical protein ACEXQD_17365 [Herbiconiux sp. P15]|uniref:hypothetical protein n=1 Tax=Herbiconiux liukaitaii TaxID=3342799 RepID=UPI0035BAE5AD